MTRYSVWPVRGSATVEGLEGLVTMVGWGSGPTWCNSGLWGSSRAANDSIVLPLSGCKDPGELIRAGELIPGGGEWGVLGGTWIFGAGLTVIRGNVGRLWFPGCAGPGAEGGDGVPDSLAPFSDVTEPSAGRLGGVLGATGALTEGWCLAGFLGRKFFPKTRRSKWPATSADCTGSDYIDNKIWKDENVKRQLNRESRRTISDTNVGAYYNPIKLIGRQRK